MAIWKIAPRTERKLRPFIISLHNAMINDQQVIKTLPDFGNVEDFGVVDFKRVGEARKIAVFYKGIRYTLGIHFYNRQNGNCLAVTDEITGRNLLQLVLDKYIEQIPQGIRIWHNGTITATANLNAQALIEFIEKEKPEFVKSEDGNFFIELGVINEKDGISFSNDAFLKFFSSLLLFSIFRKNIKDEFDTDGHSEEKDDSNDKTNFLLVNVTWNSNDWQGPSEDKSGHKWVNKGNTPHESWNFDFDNSRNNDKTIRGFCQFTNTPKVIGSNNLIVFYSQNQIVGFYGKAEVLDEAKAINKQQSYNLVGSRPLCILLRNKITHVKEKGYLEDKQRVGQVGFIYLHSKDTIRNIINEALLLNPASESQLNSLKEWLNLEALSIPSHWVFQANPAKIYRIGDALTEGILKSWMVNQYRNEIKVGDKVILWVSGESAGIYALATVTSPVHEAEVEEDEHQFFVDETKIEAGDRVNLRMDYNLVERPILKEIVLKTPGLQDLRQGTQGTNFRATKLQYDTILNIIRMEADSIALNQILFGPPGTGKTYHTVTEAVKIADNKYFSENISNRENLQSRFNELLINDWTKPEGQICFCTFHQSFSYEDFVEGIKPLKPEKGDAFIKYDVVEGIFKKICRHADASNNAQQVAKDNLVSLTLEEFNKAVFYKISLGDSTKEEDKEIYDYCISNNVIAIGFVDSIDFSGKNESDVTEAVTEARLDSYTAQAINFFKNYLKVGNYVVVSNGNSYVRALGKVTGEYEYKPDAEIRYKHFRKVEWIFKDVEIPVTEFYQKNLNQQTIYKLKSEFIIPSFFVQQRKPVDSKVERRNFVLVIDEINRGNVSSIFGELITLIEPSKRSGKPEALEVVLPYSKERFKVPSNVYLVGTMNTADRSIESLDTALRRRFSFREMTADPELILTEGKSKGTVGDIDLVKMLKKVNERIEKLIDKDHRIGHSYFLEIKTVQELELVFRDKVIPLLEEYFFGDFGKIGLVLGNSFVKKNETPDFEFADFGDYDSQTEQDLRLRSIFTIKPVEDWDYKSIYEPRSKK